MNDDSAEGDCPRYGATRPKAKGPATVPNRSEPQMLLRTVRMLFAIGVVVSSTVASQLVPRTGPRPLIVTGAAMVADGMFWFSRLTEHAGYASHRRSPTQTLLSPALLAATEDAGPQCAGNYALARALS